MSYEPTNWKDGDLVTSAKLNKLEQGVVNSILIVHAEMKPDTSDLKRLDKTWQEIHDAPMAIILASSSGDTYSYTEIYYVCNFIANTETSYYAIQLGALYPSTIRTVTLVAQSPNDYPVVPQS